MDLAILELFAPFGFAGVTTGVLLFFFFKNQTSLQARLDAQEKTLQIMMEKFVDRSLASSENATKVMTEMTETLKGLCINMSEHRAATQRDHQDISGRVGVLLDRAERRPQV
jgi:hypothetical protein